MTDTIATLLSDLRAASKSDDHARKNMALMQAIDEIVRLQASATAVGQTKPDVGAEIDDGSLTFRDGSLSVTVFAETAIVYDAEKPISARKVPLGEGFWKAAEDILGNGQVRPGSGAKHGRSAGEAAKLREEISRLREIVRRYGDRARMSMAPSGLQEVIDAAMAEATASSEQVVPSHIPTFPPDLRERCRELLEWWRTGILERESALERLADAKFADFGDERIRMAERATFRELCRISAAPDHAGSRHERQSEPQSDQSDSPDGTEETEAASFAARR